MIIFENGSYQICAAYPDSNYLSGLDCEQPKWVVPDDSPLAAKILSTQYWEPVEDENGKLTDIVPITPPKAEPSVQEKIAQLKSELTKIDSQAIRPLRAIVAGTDDEEDRKTLTRLEMQAAEIRSEIAELENKLT